MCIVHFLKDQIEIQKTATCFEDGLRPLHYDTAIFTESLSYNKLVCCIFYQRLPWTALPVLKIPRNYIISL